MHYLSTLIALNNAACDKAKKDRLDAAPFALAAFLAEFANTHKMVTSAPDHKPGDFIEEGWALADAIRAGVCAALGVQATDVDLNAEFYGALLPTISEAMSRVFRASFVTGHRQGRNR